LEGLVGRERIQRRLRTRKAVDTSHRAWVGLRGKKPARGTDRRVFGRRSFGAPRLRADGAQHHLCQRVAQPLRALILTESHRRARPRLKAEVGEGEGSGGRRDGRGKRGEVHGWFREAGYNWGE